MKVRPEIFLNTNDDVLYSKILVTGSDETLINYISNYVIKKFKKKNYYIDTSGSFDKNLTGDLFSDKKILFLLKEYSFKKEGLEKDNLANQTILITAPNGKKINLIKNKLLISNDSLVVECYPLNSKTKETVLKKYIDNNNLELSYNVFWYIIENFENKYVLFIQQLETLSLLKIKIDSIEIIETAVLIDNKIDLNKIFFCIYKNNKYVVNTFNKSIFSQTDFYIFLNSIKSFFEIITSSDSKENALSKFPKYMFSEKDVFIKIYNQLNKKKIIEIYKNISKVENLIRKNSNLYSIIGLRFLLNLKKIITS